MAKSPKGRKRNLKTVKDIAESRAKARKKLSWRQFIAKKIKQAFSWLNQPVATHSSPGGNAVVSGLTRDRSMVPAYFRNSFNELRQVHWPSFKLALRLTGAVIIFATLLTLVIGFLDSVLDRLFDRIFLN